MGGVYRYKENSETELATLFHVNREKKNSHKNNLDTIKIGDDVTSDKEKIETEVLNYFGALFNGHHDSNLVDIGHPFVPELPDFLSGLGKLRHDSQNKLDTDLRTLL